MFKLLLILSKFYNFHVLSCNIPLPNIYTVTYELLQVINFFSTAAVFDTRTEYQNEVRSMRSLMSKIGESHTELTLMTKVADSRLGSSYQPNTA